jgi:adenosylcobinamide-GDP ribazoletransferase
VKDVSALLDPLRLALGTLTAVPIAPPTSLDPPIPGRAMTLAPFTGLVPGVAAAVAAWLGLRLGLSTFVLAVITIGVFALITRGLHLDGLADTADGLAASYDRNRALEVMRRGDTGPTGLAAVVLVLLLQAAALTQVLTAAVQRSPAGTGGQLRAVVVLIAVAMAARVAIPAACIRGVPAARPAGLGATVAGSVDRVTLGLVFAAAAAICSFAGWIAGYAWWAGLLAVVIVVVTTAVLVRRAVHRFGGITGDVIGAAVEVGTAAALLVLAAAG